MPSNCFRKNSPITTESIAHVSVLWSNLLKFELTLNTSFTKLLHSSNIFSLEEAKDTLSILLDLVLALANQPSPKKYPNNFAKFLLREFGSLTSFVFLVSTPLGKLNLSIILTSSVGNTSGQLTTKN